MSEYQYYEFVAVDWPLTAAEMHELRAVSTRAAISSTRFVNEYHWGDLKGDPAKWMERYFDAFFYYANWGTHHLMLRLPAAVLEPATARRYCIGWPAEVRASGAWTVLDFTSGDEDGEFWDEENNASLAAILPVRAELAAGDLRALYLGWLLRVQEEGEEMEGEPEPPVPAGLATLTAAQEAFCEFLRIDPDLVVAAAGRSAPAADAPEPAALRRWTAALPDRERAELLAQVMEGGEGAVRAALLRHFREDAGGEAAAAGGEPRTVGELLDAAERVRAAREQREAEQAARERARRERAEAEARERRLAALATRAEEAWDEVEALVMQKKAAAYEQAVVLLRDLREVAARDGRAEEADTRVAALQVRHRTKRSFLERLEKVLR